MANERVSSKRDDPPRRDDPAPAPLGSRRLDELRSKLQFDQKNVEVALETQGKDFMDVGDAIAYAVSRRDAAKDRLKVVTAEVRLNGREEAAKDAEAKKKLTADDLTAQVEIHPDVTRARTDLNAAELELARLNALEEAWRQRSYAIKQLCELEIATHRTPDSAGPRGQYAGDRERSRNSYDERR